MGIPMLYGTCRGGPWNNKQMAHAESPHQVWIDPQTKKAWSGQIAPTADRSGKRGLYVWHPEDKAWDWKAPGAAS